MTYYSLGMSIKALRSEAGATQREAALAASVTERTYWRWERGLFAPKAVSLKRLAAFFSSRLGRRVSLEELLDGGE